MNTQAIDAAKNNVQRVQKYLDRLAIAKGYPKERIHTFIDKDGDEIPLLVADLKALLQQVTTTSTNTDTPVVPQGWKLVPVGWQFYEDGKWWNGDDRIKDHRKNTEEARYPIRDVYAVEQQSAPPEVAQPNSLESGGIKTEAAPLQPKPSREVHSNDTHKHRAAGAADENDCA